MLNWKFSEPFKNHGRLNQQKLTKSTFNSKPIVVKYKMKKNIQMKLNKTYLEIFQAAVQAYILYASTYNNLQVHT